MGNQDGSHGTRVPILSEVVNSPNNHSLTPSETVVRHQEVEILEDPSTLWKTRGHPEVSFEEIHVKETTIGTSFFFLGSTRLTYNGTVESFLIFITKWKSES